MSSSTSGFRFTQRRLAPSPGALAPPSGFDGEASTSPTTSLTNDTAGPASRTAVARALSVHKSYWKGPHEIEVLRGVDLTIYDGEFLAIIGQSGSGKSTLLHLLGTLDVPDRGEIHFDGRRVDHLPASGRDRLRNESIGMIFQFYHLLPELTALENVLVPAMIGRSVWRYRLERRTWRRRAEELLDQVGLSHRRHHRPRELSGGEMQRAAIARALLTRPRLLLADEPTGNLDEENGQSILRLLRTLNAEHDLTIVMVTHDASIASQADRTVRLSQGRVQGC